MKRKLAAILFYDVVGFSRAMGRDETTTRSAVISNQKDLIVPLAQSHYGRLIQVMGDGGFMEFSSAVEAMQFAVAMQNTVTEHNREVTEKQRFVYRIGINIGDVGVDGDFVYGDGVNTAARLEALAQPGGICVHQNVRDQLHGRLDLDFEDLGEVRVKNIDQPVHAFQVLLNEKAAAMAAQPTGTVHKPRRRLNILRAATALVALMIIIGALVWQPWSETKELASVDQMAFALPDKPSLAVLPFMNMSDDLEQEHFSDGLTDDLITDLSRISGLFVVARNSTFVYKGQSVNIAQVAEKLGVRYVLEGSVRRVDDQIRVNAQLIDATTGGHVWAERYDGVADDIFVVQDSFIRKIAKALAINLTEEEKVEIALGQTSNIKAREVFQEGWDSFLNYSAKDNAAAVERFKKAIKIDPSYGRAHAALGLAYLRGCQQRWNKPLGITRGEANSLALLALGETQKHPSSLANVAASNINLYNERYSVAQTEATLAVARDPNDPEAYIAMAWSLITTDQPDAGLAMVNRAMRLNPTYPSYYILALGIAHYSKGDLEKAAEVFSAALERDQTATELAAVLAAIHAQSGRLDEAHETLKLWKPGASQGELQHAPYSYHFPYTWSGRPEIVEQIVDGLHLAALPPGNQLANLIAGLQGSSINTRIKTAEMIARFGPGGSEAVPALIDMLGDEEKPVRLAAVVALGKIGTAAEPALPELRTLTDQPRVGYHAKKAIKAITSED
ncbi:MAG: tetratricopeptide repeat protein [Rhodobacteraceae bacterium]|nr:tetratricopeptide repeat protein [Paracoccaceae bacterium]